MKVFVYIKEVDFKPKLSGW